MTNDAAIKHLLAAQCSECSAIATFLMRRKPQAEALALLRELNDALAIPGWLQPRVDAVLDRAEEKT